VTLTKYCFLLVVAIGCGWFAAGCGSSENTDREWEVTPPPPDTTAQVRKSTFETYTDTVTTQPKNQRGAQSSAFNSSPVRFTVQVGSYSVPKNASAAQILARQRYPLPVVNEYNAARQKYQIRIGFFETEVAANEFRAQLINDHPAEYKDAWVVQIMR
jgi:hypothetical protein